MPKKAATKRTTKNKPKQKYPVVFIRPGDELIYHSIAGDGELEPSYTDRISKVISPDEYLVNSGTTEMAYNRRRKYRVEVKRKE